MRTRSALAAAAIRGTVHTSRTLHDAGLTQGEVRAQLDARRWQRFGRVVLTHNGPPTPSQRRGVALLNCGRRSALTAFSAAAHFGLLGWDRDATHVLVPAGTHIRRVAGFPVRPHFVDDWTAADLMPGRRLHRCAPSLIRAASTFPSPRPACGILAAAVQQGLVTADELRDSLAVAIRTRHRSELRAAVDDIEQGAEALSEIDFAALCRRAGLPAPVRQAVRVEPSGRRRYLDAEWRRTDGRRVVVEIDGALHLAPRRWWDDQLRQNELMIGGDLVLRFPSVVVRTEPHVVLDQLRRALKV